MSVFLFTDIEGSTKKWEKYPEEMKKILSRHDAIIKENIEECAGRIIKHTGDGVFAVFEEGKPLQSALEIQKQFEKEDWGSIGELRIRIGLYAGHAEKRGDDYFGPAVNRAARIMAVAWGGQIILTPEVADATNLPDNATLKDLGMHLLKDLREPQQIYQLMRPDLTLMEFPPLRSLSARPHNLPIQTTPFLGREQELAEIIKLLEDPSCRLLTLIGPGGVGKTRLAIQTAAEKIEDFTNGVYFISLAPLSSVDFLISTIAEALKFSFYSQEDEKIQLLNYLREKEMLLMLDNFEHLVKGAEVISEILNKAPKVKIMITSRELLNLKGEWVVQIEGMKVPKGERIDIEGYSAVQLFLYNARRVSANIVFTDEEKHYMLRICQLVGGLPLGIELASAWLRMLSCKDIAQEIEKNLDFLATSMRDVPERHRSLRAVFDYSWDLISDQEKAVLKKLSVFCGGFQRDAAEKVAGASLPILASLVDKSLLRRDISGRYELFDILKKYALQKLGEQSDEKENTHVIYCEFYANFLSQREASMIGARQTEILEEVSTEIENIRAAWDWAVEHKRNEKIGKSVTTLIQIHRKRGWLKEGEEIFRNALDKLREDNNSTIYAKVLAGYGWFSYKIGHSEKGRELLEKSLSIFRRLNVQKEVAATLNDLGEVTRLLGQRKESREMIEESLRVYRELDEHYGIAKAALSLSDAVESEGDYLGAKKLAEESLALCREIDDKYGIVASLSQLGSISHTLGKDEEAKKIYFDSLAICKEIGNHMGRGIVLNNVAIIYSGEGKHEKAAQYYEASLKIFREFGNLRGVASALTNLGIIARYYKDYEAAKKIHQEALEICSDIGFQFGIAVSYNNLAAVVRETGDLRGSEELQQKGLAIGVTVGDQWLIGMSFENLADITYRLGEYMRSREYCYKALKIALNIGVTPLIAAIFIGFAKLWIKEGRKTEALEILYFATAQSGLNQELIRDAQPFIVELEAELSAKAIVAAKKGAKIKKLEDVTKKILDMEKNNK